MDAATRTSFIERKNDITDNEYRQQRLCSAEKERPRGRPCRTGPEDRARNFYEVPYGYTPELALLEASRCLNCKKPKCVKGCPVHVDIPGFISLIQEGKFIQAAHHLKEQNALPAICGRVCPQEEQCESKCILGVKGEPVAVGRLERFVADYERESGNVAIPDLPPKTGKKVAIIGAGPAGLTAAGDLIRMGHEVTVFEALQETGGVLVYGIPEFRLRKRSSRPSQLPQADGRRIRHGLCHRTQCHHPGVDGGRRL